MSERVNKNMNQNINKTINPVNTIAVATSYAALSNVSTVINQIVNNGFLLEKAPLYLQSSITELSTYTNLLDISNPINIAGLGAFSWIGYKIITANSNNKGYEQSYHYGSHGTSRFKSAHEIKNRYYKDYFGWFLGTVDMESKYTSNNLFKLPITKEVQPYSYKLGMKGAYHPANGELNMQNIILGPPGSRKTTGYVLPNLFHIVNMYKDKEEKADIIITDPKSELFENTANYLEQNGYDVKVLDFLTLKHGDTFNPLDYISDEKMLIEICDAFCKATAGGDTEDFWESQKVQLLAAILGFIIQKNEGDKKTFAEALSLLGQINHVKADDLQSIFSKNNITGAPAQLWSNFCATAKSDNTRAGIVGTLNSAMKLFAVEGVRNLTSSTTVKIEELGVKKDKPVALFILMPDEDRSFSAIISMIISILFKQLYKTAYKTNNRLEWPVYFMLEEFCSIDPIRNITSILSTARGRRIYPSMIVQSISQLKDRYKNSWENIISQCDTLVTLGVNDKFTAEYISEILGTTTIKTSSNSSSHRKNDINQSESESYQSRRLLLPDEILKFDNNKMIVRQRATDPFILYKVQYRHWKEKFCELKPVSTLNKLKKVELSTKLDITNVDKGKEMEINEVPEVDIFNMDNMLGSEIESKYEL